MGLLGAQERGYANVGVGRIIVEDRDRGVMLLAPSGR